MPAKPIMRIALISALLLAGTAAGVQMPPQESLGDIARKARAQHETPRAVRVYTEADLARLRLLPINIIGTAIEETDEPAESTTEALRSAEVQWRRRFSEARRDLAQTESLIARLQRAFDSEASKSLILEWPIATCSTDGKSFAPGHPQSAMIENLCRNLSEAKKHREQMRASLVDLEDELRRSGGYPGWARE